MDHELERVRELVQSEPESINAALLEAVIHDARGVAECLLEHGADPNTRRDADSGCTPLFYVKNVAMIELLLRFGADVHSRDVNGRDVLNAYLLRVARSGKHYDRADVSVVRRLLDAGLPVRNGARAHLAQACSVGDVPTIELLLARGADPNQQEALVAAVNCSRPAEVFAALVRGGIDSNARCTASGLNTSILTEICRHGDLASAQLLLAHGADVNFLGRSSPLARAEESGNQVLVDLLLERGAAPLLSWTPPEVLQMLDSAEARARAEPGVARARLRWALTLRTFGFRAAAAHEAGILRRRGVEPPPELLSFQTAGSSRWTFVDFPPGSEELTPRIADERFPRAVVTDGTRTLPLLLVMGAPCTRCDDKGEEVCGLCEGSGRPPAWLPYEEECALRQRCSNCRGLKFANAGPRFSTGRCQHSNVVEELRVGEYTLSRCEQCGLGALKGDAPDFACAVCGRLACYCEFARR